MKHKSWRDHARPIIAEVIKNNHGKDKKELRKLINEEYPFGERAYHPYKIWLSEIKVQLEGKKFGKKNNVDDPNQKKMF
jgi:hypothetical protein